MSFILSLWTSALTLHMRIFPPPPSLSLEGPCFIDGPNSWADRIYICVRLHLILLPQSQCALLITLVTFLSCFSPELFVVRGSLSSFIASGYWPCPPFSSPVFIHFSKLSATSAFWSDDVMSTVILHPYPFFFSRGLFSFPPIIFLFPRCSYGE